MTRDEILAAARAALRELLPVHADKLAELFEAELTSGDFSSNHATLAEVTLVRFIEGMLRRALGDEAGPVLERFAHKRAEARAYKAFLPRSSSTFERTEGKGSSHIALTETCPACQAADAVHYEGSNVLAGSLAQNHLVHTEVDDLFGCVACGHTWAENRFI